MFFEGVTNLSDSALALLQIDDRSNPPIALSRTVLNVRRFMVMGLTLVKAMIGQDDENRCYLDRPSTGYSKVLSAED